MVFYSPLLLKHIFILNTWPSSPSWSPLLLCIWSSALLQMSSYLFALSLYPHIPAAKKKLPNLPFTVLFSISINSHLASLFSPTTLRAPLHQELPRSLSFWPLCHLHSSPFILHKTPSSGFSTIPPKQHIQKEVNLFSQTHCSYGVLWFHK